MNNLISVFNKAIEYIEEKIKNSEEITNKDIAEICGYEQHYCSKIFQKYANMNIQKYVKKRKMTFAFIDLIKAEENVSALLEHSTKASTVASNVQEAESSSVSRIRGNIG